MKKIFLTLSFVLVLFCLILSSCKTFDGYYYDLEKARNEKKFYDNLDYLFTQDSQDVIIDFIVEDDTLHIVQIETKDYKTNAKYRVKHTSSYAIKEAIYKFDQSNDYNWITTSNLSPKKVSWCIVSKDFNSINNNYTCFEFVYEGKPYSLCYDMNN